MWRSAAKDNLRPQRKGYFGAQSHTPRNRCVRFVFGIAAASRNTRFQAACWALPGPDFHRLIAPASWRTFDRLQGRCPARPPGVTMRAPPQCVVMIRPLDANMPSAWLSIGGRPFLDYLLLEAWRFGFSKVLFIADGGGSRVRASLDASRIGEETRLSIDVVDAKGAGTGGALHAAR